MVCLHDIPAPQMPAHSVYGENTVQIGRGGAERDEGIHIRRAVPKGFEADSKIFLVDDEYGRCQQKLRQGEAHNVFIAQQDRGQGCAHHMPHGDIKQRNKETERRNQPLFHGMHFLRRDIARGFAGGVCLFCALWECAVAAAFYGVDNVVRFQDGFIVFYGHGILEKVDVNCGDALQLADAFFHMRGTGGAGHACNVEFLFHEEKHLPMVFGIW